MPGKSVHSFLAHTRSGTDEMREKMDGRRSLMIMLHLHHLLGVLPRWTLTHGLPQLPLSNGCMFQGKYPTETRTLVTGP